MPTHQLIWTEHEVLPPDLEIDDEIRYFDDWGHPKWRKVVALDQGPETTAAIVEPHEIIYEPRWWFSVKEVVVSPSVFKSDEPLHVRRRHRVEVKGLG